MLIRLDELPVSERFDYWWESVGRSVVSVEASSEVAHRFWARMESADFGQVQVSRVTCLPFEACRTSRLIRDRDPGTLHLSLTLHGCSGLHQNRMEADLRAGDLVLYDTSRPFRAWTGRLGQVSEGIVMQLPRDALTVPERRLQSLMALRLPGRTGLGGLLAASLRQLTSDPAGLPPAYSPRVASTLLSLLDGLLEWAAGEPPPGPPPSRRSLLVRAHAYIEERLHDPVLSPVAVAAALSVSLRHLYALFEQEGLTVADWIRRRRLTNARHDLADPRCDHLTVGMIGARWGFMGDSQFSRAFRTVYGVAPGAFRRARIAKKTAHDDNTHR
ncbi:helix-turn-helix domain-containing protein [Herbidospora cretacea]|uniref:AraC-like ligand-binding domain-containing protein n=1 Tax=Herbidospora cretacea TaxID=28444 RepID=UPI000ADC5A31|nr:helix-turn-helix domain-containing protein [Herbidospora cretacea]